MISDGTFKEFECALSDDRHFLHEPIELPCGDCACKSCIPKDDEYICNSCNEVIKNKFVYQKKSNSIQLGFKRHLDDVFKIIEKQSLKSIDELKGSHFIFQHFSNSQIKEF
jgi:hypothetical protein